MIYIVILTWTHRFTACPCPRVATGACHISHQCIAIIAGIRSSGSLRVAGNINTAISWSTQGRTVHCEVIEKSIIMYTFECNVLMCS